MTGGGGGRGGHTVACAPGKAKQVLCARYIKTAFSECLAPSPHVLRRCSLCFRRGMLRALRSRREAAAEGGVILVAA